MSIQRMRTMTLCLILALALGHFVAPVSVRAASPAPTLQAISEEIAAIAKKAGPAVVQIVATVRAKSDPRREELLERMMPFLDPRLRDQLPESIEPPPRQGVGSGCIIDPSGVILTNSHVVKDADKIQVILSGNGPATKKEYEARIIGVDPDSDVAVIQIDAKDLPVLDLGDSDSIKVGHLVLAIGNPQGLRCAAFLGDLIREYLGEEAL